jgi:hypothetical protein
MSIETSELLLGRLTFTGPTVTDILTQGNPLEAFNGSIKTEFDIAVKHWIAYALGLTSATGLVIDNSAWFGLFDHFAGKSASDYRDLPEKPENLARLNQMWVPGGFHSDTSDKQGEQ